MEKGKSKMGNRENKENREIEKIMVKLKNEKKSVGSNHDGKLCPPWWGEEDVITRMIG